MRKFIRYYRPYRKIFILDMICALLISVIDLAFPQVLNYLNKTLYLDTKEAILNSLGLLLIGLFIMYGVRAPRSGEPVYFLNKNHRQFCLVIFYSYPVDLNFTMCHDDHVGIFISSK